MTQAEPAGLRFLFAWMQTAQAWFRIQDAGHTDFPAKLLPSGSESQEFQGMPIME
jgi:hypothetical protein